VIREVWVPCEYLMRPRECEGCWRIIPSFRKSRGPAKAFWVPRRDAFHCPACHAENERAENWLEANPGGA